jgi:uncharacterized protein (DUF2147 family)
MQKSKVLFSLLFLLISCTPLVADEIVGFWKTINEETARTQSIIAIYEYLGNFYGRIIASCDKNGDINDSIYAPIGRSKKMPGNPFYCGMDILLNLRPSAGKYKGKIIDPRDGSVYSASVWRSDDNLIIRGELLFFGKSITWRPAWNSDFPDDFKKPDLKKFIPLAPQVD